MPIWAAPAVAQLKFSQGALLPRPPAAETLKAGRAAAARRSQPPLSGPRRPEGGTGKPWRVGGSRSAPINKLRGASNSAKTNGTKRRVPHVAQKLDHPGWWSLALIAGGGAWYFLGDGEAMQTVTAGLGRAASISRCPPTTPSAIPRPR